MNNPTRNGKIARLPKAIRQAINQRLDEGATAKSLVDWLNELPEVQAVIQAEFDGYPIREQNLSQWKNGGYREWVQHQGALELAERLYERDEDLRAQGKTGTRPPLSDMLSYWLLSRYVQATAEIEAAEGAEAWKLQRQFCDDLAKTRRGEHRAEQLRIEQEKVELKREELKLQRERFEATMDFAPESDEEEDTDPQSDTGDTPSGTHRPTQSRSRVRRGTTRRPSPPMMSHEPPTEEEMEARWRQILNIPFRPPGERPPSQK